MSTVTTTTTTDDSATARRTENSDASETSDVRPDSLASDSDPMPRSTRNLYVRNMPPGFTADDMTKLFSGYGEVISTKMIVDIKKGTPLGFGFIMFAKASEAETAIVAMNGSVVDGYQLMVRPAEPGTREPGEPSERLLLRKLPPTASERVVLEYCSQLLAQPHSAFATGVKVFQDGDGYRTAWLHCTTPDVAQRLAAALNNSVNFPGRQDMPRSRRRTVFAKVLSRGETFTPPAPALVRFPSRPPTFDPTNHNHNPTTAETTSSVHLHPSTQPSPVHLHHHHHSTSANLTRISPFAPALVPSLATVQTAIVSSLPAVPIAPASTPTSPTTTTAAAAAATATSTTLPIRPLTADFTPRDASQAASLHALSVHGGHHVLPPAQYLPQHLALYQHHQHHHHQHLAAFQAPQSAPEPIQLHHLAIALATEAPSFAMQPRVPTAAQAAPVVLLNAPHAVAPATAPASYSPVIYAQLPPYFTQQHQQQHYQPYQPSSLLAAPTVPPVPGPMFTLAPYQGLTAAGFPPVVSAPVPGPAPSSHGVVFAYPPHPNNTFTFR